MIDPTDAKLYDVLLVDDSISDAELLQELMARILPDVRLRVEHDSLQVLQDLQREARLSDGFRPDLLLMDLHMPRKSGFEVLRKLRSDAAFKSIPMLVLSDSARPEEIGLAYDLGANAYLMKPTDIQGYVELLQSVDQNWFRFSKLSR
ncbi:response regulator [Deinococcus peraridilitoris]|uniref:Response regulator containing a CheY-like receiver domain and a GGDEF domain protein n=1 Tax=Deinococcus peraridilitoris (strain DSM 19664 / LMG 22246 / CIP 109416 / KR-200) TaxID=937777 RepID=L0A276_DEIPD|nr:response regulator [Deinococcus peraridilitoris]AFZ67090.1 response regulator containing a CheY-like receiver domain and a GGDEF domain protein [Deinococcus peraridilitoris DSM 19664]